MRRETLPAHFPCCLYCIIPKTVVECGKKEDSV